MDIAVSSRADENKARCKVIFGATVTLQGYAIISILYGCMVWI